MDPGGLEDVVGPRLSAFRQPSLCGEAPGFICTAQEVAEITVSRHRAPIIKAGARSGSSKRIKAAAVLVAIE
jgi:hypothetical protein